MESEPSPGANSDEPQRLTPVGQRTKGEEPVKSFDLGGNTSTGGGGSGTASTGGEVRQLSHQ